MHPRPLLVTAAVALASIAFVATQSEAQSETQPTHAAGHAATAAAPRQAARTGAAATPVELTQHRGVIVGDGHTVYLANRTEFRPRRREIALPPRVRARAWAVVDLTTGRLLGEHDARRWLPQASTMKLLTAVTAANNHHLQFPHTVTRAEAHQTCTCAGLAIGHPYAFQTLLEGMLLPSGNDAAEALAGSHPRGSDAFYAAMNRTAARLGASDTVARNASGLTAAGSHSSARDLVVLLRAALRHRVVRQVMTMPSAEIASVDGRRRHTIWRGTDYVNLYPHSLGKSGYTTPAGNTLVVGTWIDGHHIAVSVMHAPYGYVTSDARRLTEWAAKNFTGLARVGRLPQS